MMHVAKTNVWYNNLLALAFSAACRFLSRVLSGWVDYLRRYVLTMLRVSSMRPSLSGRTLSKQHPGIDNGRIKEEVLLLTTSSWCGQRSGTLRRCELAKTIKFTLQISSS